MCLIIHRPEGVQIPDYILSNSHYHNDDGWGVMWAQGGRVQTFKSLSKDVKDMAAFIDSLPDDQPYFTHQRLRTHGATDLSQVHPYPILTLEEDDRDIFMMHNGVLRIMELDSSKSDTWHLAALLRSIFLSNPDSILDPKFQENLGKEIGSSNKLAILSGDGTEVIINKDAGVEREGLWLSNTYSIVAPTYSGGSGYYSQHYGGRFRYEWADDDAAWEAALEVAAETNKTPPPTNAGVVSLPVNGTSQMALVERGNGDGTAAIYPERTAGPQTSGGFSLASPRFSSGVARSSDDEESLPASFDTTLDMDIDEITAEDVAYLDEWQMEYIAETYPKVASALMFDLSLMAMAYLKKIEEKDEERGGEEIEEEELDENVIDAVKRSISSAA